MPKITGMTTYFIKKENEDKLAQFSSSSRLCFTKFNIFSVMFDYLLAF